MQDMLKQLSYLGLVLVIFAPAATAGLSEDQSNAFTYQGELWDDGNRASGQFDLRFSLFDGPTGDTTLAAALVFPDQSVAGGVFSVLLNFGEVIRNGGEQWLEIGLRRSGEQDFLILSPRQRLRAVPRARVAAVAGPAAVTSQAIVTRGVSVSDIAAGAVSSAEIGADAVESNALDTGSVSTSKLQSGAVNRDHLNFSTVGSSRLQTNAVGTEELATDSVGSSAIATDAVGSGEIQSDAVELGALARDAVLANHIAIDAVGAEEIRPQSVHEADIVTSQVQARVNGVCPAGASIRSILSSGGVNCETDSEGVVGFNSPTAYSVSSQNGGGTQSVQMMPVNSHICLLSEVDTRDVDNGNEEARCEIVISGGRWQLDASAAPGYDADAFCGSLCFRVNTSL